MDRVLITGGTGFVGSALVREALLRDCEVHVVARSKANRDNLSDITDRVTWHVADLEDKGSIHSVLSEVKPNVVFHCAALLPVSGKVNGVLEHIHTNIEGTVHLMNSAMEVGVEAFINTGSFSEYGYKDTPVKEDAVCNPTELYGISKLAATLYGAGLAEREAFPCITFRLFTPYGPRLERGVIYNLITKMKNHEPVAMSKKTIARDFIHVEDVPALYFEAVEKVQQYKGEVFNAGSGTAVQLEEVVQILKTQLASKSVIEWDVLPVLSYDSELWQADMSKTFGAFEWRPVVGLCEGIEKTLSADSSRMA